MVLSPTRADELRERVQCSPWLIRALGAVRDSGLSDAESALVLGSGRQLFPGERPTLELSLTDYAVQDGKVRLVYKRR